MSKHGTANIFFRVNFAYILPFPLDRSQHMPVARRYPYPIVSHSK